MKRISFLLLLIPCLVTTATNAQRVETLVKGASTFDDGLAVDSSGNIYASRYYGNTITKITPSGETEIYSSGFTNPNAIAFDNDGFLLVPSAGGGRVERILEDGSKEVIIKGIHNPTGVAVDSIGNIYISQYQLSKIIKIDTAGVSSTFLSGGLLNGPVGLIFDREGDLFIGNFDDGKILRHNTETGTSVVGDVPGWLGSFTLAEDYIYATALQRNLIYRISKDGGEQNIFSGTGTRGSKDGLLVEATFSGPNGIAASNTGDTLYISDFYTRSLRMITGLIPNNPKIKVSGVLDFGEVNIEMGKVFERYLKIENVGNDQLLINRISITDSLFKSDIEEMNIPAYSSDSLKVTFIPNETGNIESTLQLFTVTNSEFVEVKLIAQVVMNTTNEPGNQNLIPKGITLYQNYPNPFNPVTIIKFNMARASDISLDVFDVQGRKIKTLLNGRLQMGDHNIEFNGSDLPTGVYYCVLKAQENAETIKITLIK